MTRNRTSQYSQQPKTFVRRGRLTKSQKASLASGDRQMLLPADQMLCQKEAFGREANHFCLEIGFGMGENLLQVATEFPDVDFLGVDVHAPGAGRVVRDAQRQNIGNIRLYLEDIIVVMNHCIYPGTIDSCFILFPDPWPKNKHRKRRLIQPTFLDLLWTSMAVGGYVWIATDWEDYAEQIRSVFTNDTRWRSVDPSDIPMQRHTTRFEQRGERFQHNITDTIWQKIPF